jgi:alpha-glucosidase (family GH31 glycosyl hydrolase)
VKAFYDKVPVDGLWIDMNEISNFCNDDGLGQVCVNSAEGGCPVPGTNRIKCCLVCTTVDATNSLENPPYAISNSKGRISRGTVDVASTQYGGLFVYNTHNLYGRTEQIATRKALIDIRGKRPFVLSRSSFVSTGVHSAKWTGDNGATWNNLKASIVGMMDFSLFGIPMIDSDICGFIYNTTEELCARWIEVGAFCPFSRAHNDLDQTPQELYLWESVAEASRNALGMRYQLLPYMYTLLYKAHTTR